MEAANQTNTYAYMQRVLAEQSLPPAMLLYGPPGSGKGHLARTFARDYLCRTAMERGSTHHCDACHACDLSATLRHPDYIILDNRDIVHDIEALLAVAERPDPEKFRRAAMNALYELEKKFSSGLWPVRKTVTLKKGSEGNKEGTKDSRVRFPGEEFLPQYAELEKQLRQAEGLADMVAVLEELEKLNSFVHRDNIPVDSVRAIRETLGRRPVLSNRRVVLLGDAGSMRQEAANAFLKTLEEPPKGTVIIMTATDPDQVLPTIRSRSALLPIRKMRRETMEALARERFGLTEPVSAEGFHDFRAYLRSHATDTKEIQEYVVSFFEYLASSGQGSAGFDLAGKLAEKRLVLPFLVFLGDVIADTILARETGYGQERLMPRMLNGYHNAFLRTMREKVEALQKGITVNNLNARMQIIALFMQFYNAGE